MRTKKDKPAAEPLANVLRAALASDWRTLAALDTLAGDPAGTRRHRVHAALRGLRGEGVVFEERTSKGVAEVRISPATLPAPRPDDGNDGLDADDREAARAAIQVDLDAEPPCDPDNFEGLEGMRLCLGCEHPAHLHAGGPVGGQCLHQERGTECSCVAWVEPNARAAEPTADLAAPAPPVGQAAPVEAVGGAVARDLSARPVNALSAHLAAMGHVEEAREVAGLPPAPKGPGPSSRCAVCGVPYAQHAVLSFAHAFQPKPRGRPRARLAAAQAADPDVEELPTPAEQKAILDGAKRDYEAAVAGEGAGAEPETSRGGSDPQAPPAPVASSIADALRSRFPDAFAPEIIDGSDVATVAREMVDLTIAFSPVIARRDSIDAVGVTPLDNGRFRVDALWETTGLPMEVDAAGLAVMRARYLLLRGLLTRSLSAMDFDTRRAVVQRFFQGVEPWAPAPGSPLARMGAGPITITVPDGVGVEGIDWTALMGALAGEGGEVPAVVPVRPLGPPPPPAPPPEPPAAHVLEGEHSRACGYWKVHDPAHCDPAKLAAEIKICRACWGKMYALGGGRPRVEDGRKYVGDRYV